MKYYRSIIEDKISKVSTVVDTKEQVWCKLVGESVILNLKSAIDYGLNAVGAKVWSLIQQPTAVNSALDTLINEYDVEPGSCEGDLLKLLQELKSRELIDVEPGTNGKVK